MNKPNATTAALKTNLQEWAGIARRQGLQDSAELLTRAAAAIENNTRSDELSLEMQIYAAQASEKGQPGFARTLTEAAEALSSS